MSWAAGAAQARFASALDGAFADDPSEPARCETAATPNSDLLPMLPPAAARHATGTAFAEPNRLRELEFLTLAVDVLSLLLLQPCQPVVARDHRVALVGEFIPSPCHVH